MAELRMIESEVVHRMNRLIGMDRLTCTFFSTALCDLMLSLSTCL